MPRIGYQKRKFKTIIMLDDGTLTWADLSATTVYPFGIKVTGDTYNRFQIRADGRLEWGGGAGALDCVIRRQMANMIAVDDKVWLNRGTVSGSSNVATAIFLEAQVEADTAHRFESDMQGVLEWGPGNAALDCLLSRRAANILNTPDRMEVGTLGVGNSAGGDVTATSADYKVQVFDAAGNSLGYLQVFAG